MWRQHAIGISRPPWSFKLGSWGTETIGVGLGWVMCFFLEPLQNGMRSTTEGNGYFPKERILGKPWHLYLHSPDSNPSLSLFFSPSPSWFCKDLYWMSPSRGRLYTYPCGCGQALLPALLPQWNEPQAQCWLPAVSRAAGGSSTAPSPGVQNWAASPSGQRGSAACSAHKHSGPVSPGHPLGVRGPQQPQLGLLLVARHLATGEAAHRYDHGGSTAAGWSHRLSDRQPHAMIL